MRTKIIAVLTLAVLSTAAWAATEITVTSEPALPQANQVKNSGFESGTMKYWQILKGAQPAVKVDTAVSSEGSCSAVITGDKSNSYNFFQRVRWNPPLKKNTPWYLRLKTKKEGAFVKGGKAASLAVAFDPAVKGKLRYTSVPNLPLNEMDWAEFDAVGEVPMDSRLATIYFCVYNGSGKQYFDDIQFYCGTTQLKVAVKGDALKRVVVRHSVTGTVLDEAVSGNEFAKTLTVPAFGSYSVDAVDQKDVRTSKLYPENVDSNVAASDTVIPLTAVKRVVIPGAKSDEFNFTLPDIAGKKVYLEFSGRVNKREGLAGYSVACRMSVNNKQFGVKHIIKPCKQLSIKANPGRKIGMVHRNGVILYYCNSFFAISPENTYCPLTIEDRNPFNYQFDITELVKAGSNQFKAVNLFPAGKKAMDVYLENIRVVIK